MAWNDADDNNEWNVPMSMSLSTRVYTCADRGLMRKFAHFGPSCSRSEPEYKPEARRSGTFGSSSRTEARRSSSFRRQLG